MSESELSIAGLPLRRILLGILLGLLGLLCFWVLMPFLAPIAWAAIVAYASWPVYRRARTPLGKLNTTAASLMTLLVACAVVLPVLWQLVLV